MADKEKSYSSIESDIGDPEPPLTAAESEDRDEVTDEVREELSEAAAEALQRLQENEG